MPDGSRVALVVTEQGSYLEHLIVKIVEKLPAGLQLVKVRSTDEAAELIAVYPPSVIFLDADCDGAMLPIELVRMIHSALPSTLLYALKDGGVEDYDILFEAGADETFSAMENPARVGHLLQMAAYVQAVAN